MDNKGEKEKLAILYGERLLRSAFLLCGNESDAQDLAQETLLQGIKKMDTFRRESSLYTWLYGILLNLNRRRIRKKKRLFVFSDLKYVQQVSVDPIRDLENKMDRERLSQQIFGLIKSLSTHHQEVIVLRYYEGFSIDEMADTLGASKGTVKSRLHYATRNLRKKMAGLLNLFSGSGTK